jgi:hypothetical protein
MDKIPNDILSLILSFVLHLRTELTCVFNYELVCKRWRNLINSRSFNALVFAKPSWVKNEKSWLHNIKKYHKFSLENVNFRRNLYYMTQKIIPIYQTYRISEEIKIIDYDNYRSESFIKFLYTTKTFCQKYSFKWFNTNPSWSILRRINWKYKEKPSEWDYTKRLHLDYSVFSVLSVPIGTERTERVEASSMLAENYKKLSKDEIEKINYLFLLDHWISLCKFPYNSGIMMDGCGWYDANKMNSQSYAQQWKSITYSLTFLIENGKTTNVRKYIYNFICKYYPLIDWNNSDICKQFVDQRFVENHMELCEILSEKIIDWLIGCGNFSETFVENTLIKYFCFEKKYLIDLKEIILKKSYFSDKFYERMEILFNLPSTDDDIDVIFIRCYLEVRREIDDEEYDGISDLMR